MRVATSALVLLSAGFLLGACSGASGLAGAGKHSATSGKEADSGGDNSGDDEAAKSGQPQQVAGAFLTGCAPITSEGPQDPSKDTVGCAIMSKTTGKKYTGLSAATAVVWKKDGTADKPTVSMAPSSSKYNFYFQTATGVLGAMESLTLHTTLRANSFGWNNVSMHEQDSDPATWVKDGSLGSASVASMGQQQIFLSSAQVTPGGSGAGSFSGVAGADAVCATLASTANLPGTWVALMSDATVDAKSHVQVTGAVTDVNGTMVAPDATSFWGAHAGVVIDEGGQALTKDLVAWTGTNGDGSKANDTCTSWTSGASVAASSSSILPQLIKGNTGAADSKSGAAWISNGANVCGSDALSSGAGGGGAHRLYCVSVNVAGPASAPTSTLGSGATGSTTGSASGTTPSTSTATGTTTDGSTLRSGVTGTTSGSGDTNNNGKNGNNGNNGNNDNPFSGFFPGG